MPASARVAIAGCGRLTEVGYLPALALLGGIELTAVVDPDRERCARVAPGTPAFGSLGELLAAARPDLVVVATPTATHLPLAREAAAAGVRTLVEKPPAATLAEAQELAQLVPEPQLGFNRRFDPRLEELRDTVRAAGRGELELRLQLSIAPRAWGAYGTHDGPLLDLGPHVLDLAWWLSGREPERVRRHDGPDGVERLEVAWTGGRAEVELSHATGWRELVEARVGGRVCGRVAAGGLAGRIAGRLRGGASPLPATLAAQLRAALGRLDGTAPAPARDGIRVMALIAAALRSREKGGSWVEVTGMSPVD